MSVFDDIEKQIERQMKKLLGTGAAAASAGGRELVEIHRGILDDVAAHIETLPRGRRVFPYDQLAVTIPVPEPERRAAFEVAFAEGEGLAGAIRAFLAQERCEYPGAIEVETTFSEDPMPDFAEHGFHIRYGKRAERGAKPAPAGVSSPLLPAIRLTVLSGQAAQNVYEVQRQAITVGRLAELFDARQRLTRRNDVAFDDSEDPPNNTVSRAHAHLRYDAEAGGFRLFDDGSAHGTGVFRDGRLAQVPAGSRGFRLQSGDEIYFGQARVRFETVGTL